MSNPNRTPSSRRALLPVLDRTLLRRGLPAVLLVALLGGGLMITAQAPAPTNLPPDPPEETTAALAPGEAPAAQAEEVLAPTAPAPPAPAPAAAPVALVLKQIDAELFPLPSSLAPNVTFWNDVFSRYSSDQVVLHDEWHTQRIYAVLDFTDLATSPLSEAARERRRKDAVRTETTKIRVTLQDLAAGRSPSYPEDAKRIAALIGAVPASEYRLAADRVRDQAGLKDYFAAAIGRAGRYLPGIERLFTSRTLPLALTRLPFVESMFQENARSKVAAGGIWQIMPSTGRRFLRVSADVDERFDPLLAAGAAASVLQENFRYLGTWPLAITAYNHGPGGLMRAVSNLGTRDIGTIVSKHQGRTFGFASRNFYAEFVAAANLYENREHFFPDSQPLPELTFDEMLVPHYVPAPALAAKAGLSVADVAMLNPAVDPDVWTGRVLLPAGYRLRVPAGQAAAFQTAYAALPPEVKVARQAGTQHRVKSGETLSVIARRHGVSVAAIQQANRMGKKTVLRVGQMLAIPGRMSVSPAPTRVAAVTPAPVPSPAASTTTQAAVAPALPAPDPDAAEKAASTEAVDKAAPKEHVVRAGDTLFSISRRYGVPIKTLMQANGLKGGRIYPGQRLSLAR